MPVKLSGPTSLSQSGGNGVSEAAVVLVASGLTVRAGAVATVQLPARQLSCRGSINCNEPPVPSALVGQGGTRSNSTSATTGLLEPLPSGCNSVSGWPACKVPVKRSNTVLVAP